MTKKLNKRGFTIVELVVVIVVIAILAAVLIPTVSSLINKANRSADIQAVSQMNKALAMSAVTEQMDITKVYEALGELGMNAKDYSPLASDTYFFWDSYLNRILYTNKNYEVQYPEQYADITRTTEGHQWYSLNNKVEEKPVDKDSDGTYSASTVEELYWLANQIDAGKIDNGVKIKITANEIDLMGADVSFGCEHDSKDNWPGYSSFELIGADSGTVLKGLSQIVPNESAEDKNYSSGLIPYLKMVTAGTATIKNITIENSVIGNTETGSVGALIGTINGGTKVTIENCHVNNTVVYGKNKVGGLVGQIQTSVVSINDCSLTNVDVNCSEGESGMVIGCLVNKAQVTLDKQLSAMTTKCTLNLVDGTFARTKYLASEATGLTYAAQFTEGSYLVDAKKADGSEDGKYRVFAPNAYATICYLGENGYLKYNSTTYYNEVKAYPKNDHVSVNSNTITVVELCYIATN